MSWHHSRPFGPAPSFSNKLPPNTFGALVGTVDGPLNDDDRNEYHVLIPITVGSGEYQGLYQAAFNVESKFSGDGGASDDVDGRDPDGVEVSYYTRSEVVQPDDVPSEGFYSGDDVELSYARMGLTNDLFHAVNQGNLRTLVTSAVQSSTRICVYGNTYGGSDAGTGIHDIHMNSGEPQGSGFPSVPGHDGALACYFTQGGQQVRQWIFIKFQGQQIST